MAISGFSVSNNTWSAFDIAESTAFNFVSYLQKYNLF